VFPFCLAFFLVLRCFPTQAAALVSRIGCPDIPVKSLATSLAFFTEVLDFKLIGREDTSGITRLAPGMPSRANSQTAHLQLGGECVDLTEYSGEAKSKLFPVDSHGNDQWFQHLAIVVSDMDKAYRRLLQAHVAFVSDAPQTLPEWNKNAAGISAFYFRDPDGHYLELIHFPVGKGSAKWQNPTSGLFLGVDHTAITIAKTARSLTFYKDLFGLSKVGGSENYGVEQEHLSGVPSAHVLITSLRAADGIGIEFLDYVSPTSGRPISCERAISELSNWQLPLEWKGDSAAGPLKPDWKKVTPSSGSPYEVAWVRDPDGHQLKLIKKP
jgi:catechol 2,3-dioxygenase-like lactoylglutathione lyase family enzyme